MKNVWIIVSLLVGMIASSAHALDRVLVLRVSNPFMVSGAAGLQFGEPTGELRPLILGEAGIGGGKLAVGLDKTGQGAFGYGLKAAYLRTWFEPLSVDEDQDFIGIEVEVSVYRLLFNLGGYVRIGDGDDDWLGAGGIGFMF